MKRFRFRLQRVLDIREQICDELRQELALRNQELQQQLNVLAYLDSEFERSRITENGMLTAREVEMTGAYCARVQQQIVEQRVRVEHAKAAVAEAQERYIQANKDAKAIDMLKDKKRAQYHEEVLKEEMNQLDEFAVQRASAKE
jgi:flagellar FliJ protein